MQDKHQRKPQEKLSEVGEGAMQVKTTQNRKRNRATPGPGGEHLPFVRDPYVNTTQPSDPALLGADGRVTRPPGSLGSLSIATPKVHPPAH